MKAVVAMVAVLFAVSGTAVQAQEQALGVQAQASERGNLALTLELPASENVTSTASPEVTVEIEGRVVPAEIQGISGEVLTQNVLLLVDTSGSMADGRLASVRRAIREFTEPLDPSVQLSLATFASDVTLVIPPTVNRGDFRNGLQALQVGGDTALFDGLASALRQPVERIIVFSDGADTVSRTSIDEVLALLRASSVVVDVVAIESSPEQREQLQAVAAAGSGRFLSAGEFSAALIESVIARPIINVEVGVPWQPELAETPISATVTFADGKSFMGETLPAPAAPATPVTEDVASSPPSWLPGLFAFAVFVGIAAGVVLISLFVQRILIRFRTRRVMRHYFGPTDVEDESQKAGWRGIALVRSSFMKRLAEALDDAEIPISPPAWIGLWAVTALVGGAMFGALRWWLFLPGLAVGAIIPWLVVRARISANQRRFEMELPDFLTLVASGLRSGLSFGQAVGGAAVSGSDALARQMRRVTAEVSVGVNLADALDHVAGRMESRDLRWTVQALRVQGEVGGSLSRILDIAARAVRQRAQLNREVRTLSAEGRLSAIILMILPAAIFLFFLIIRPEYIAVFWTSTVGWVLLAFLLVLLALGALWMRRIAEIRV